MLLTLRSGGEDYRQIVTFPHFEDPNGLKRITVAWPGEKILIKSDVNTLLLTKKNKLTATAKKISSQQQKIEEKIKVAFAIKQLMDFF